MEENKQKNEEYTNQINTMIDTYIRRQGVIKSKFPDIGNPDKTPISVRDEYYALNTLIDSLNTTRRGVWGKRIASDGVAIDGFVKEKYEMAINEYRELNKENELYITQEEEKNFEFPDIGIESLREQVQAIQNRDDADTVFKKLITLRQQPLPENTQYEINDLMGQIWVNLSAREKEVKESQAEKPAVVDESKLAKIYGKAKGKIQEVFGKIKSLLPFKQQSQDKNHDNQDIDGRE